MNHSASAAATVERRLRGLFPLGTSLALSTRPAEPGALLEAERAATGGMAPGRLQTFAQGRVCARVALAQLGYPDTPVPVGEQRAPLWPAGVCGSIAHCDGQAVAVAARREVSRSIGVDLEKVGPLDAGVVALVCTPGERLAVAAHGDETAKLIFVIKEAVYKCLWPLTRRFIDFQDVEIEADFARRRYRALPVSDALNAATVHSIRGRWTTSGGVLYASAYLPSTPAL